MGWVSFHWLQKGLDDLSSRVASTGSTSPPSPTASAPQHSTGTPCAADGQAILGRRQLPCDMVGASDGDNQGNSQARQSDRMAHSLGIQRASPSPSLQLWFLGLLQFYVQCFASFSSFFCFPLPPLPAMKDHFNLFFIIFQLLFFIFPCPQAQGKDQFLFSLFCLFF